MVIINANDRVIPDYSLPHDEWYREISMFYVAMTRAKKELIISYSTKLSGLFDFVKEYFNEDLWKEHIISNPLQIDIPHLNGVNFSKNQASILKGKDFLYHRKAIGISKELQNKLIEHVAGKSISFHGKKEGWMNMEELKNDIISKRNIPHLSSLFGPSLYKELENLFIN